MNERLDNVIYVSFGRRPPSEPASPMPMDASVVPSACGLMSQSGEPQAGVLYKPAEVSQLLGISRARLQTWARSGLLMPSAEMGIQRFYTFEDLIGLRAAKGLLGQGLPFRTVRDGVMSLRRVLPQVTRPLNELRIVADGKRLLVRHEGTVFEPTTGQLLIDFQSDTLHQKLVQFMHESVATSQHRREAYAAYLEGCRWDDDASTLDQAEAAYRRALAIDPKLASALTNLGNIRYKCGDLSEAATFYTRALEVDSDQPEAAYNLGFMAYRRSEYEVAHRWFRLAVNNDPGFADAHFNLGMTLDRLGRGQEACKHWQAFLKLDPNGPWSATARTKLAHANQIAVEREGPQTEPGIR